MKMSRTRTVAASAILSVIVILGLFAGSALAGKGGKGGGGGGGGGTTANVEYEVVWLGTLGGSNSWAHAANSSGEIVGMSEDSNGTLLATRFTPQGPVDLNVEMADLLAARDDGPWLAWIASSINELGQITGSIRQPGGRSHPFIFDPGDIDLGRVRQLSILPQLFEDTTKAWCINDLGQIVGEYWGNGGGSFVYSPGESLIDIGPVDLNGHLSDTQMNNAGQIAFLSGRYTPTAQLGDTGTFDSFPGYLYGVNGDGVVVGAYRTEAKKGRNKYVDTIYRGTTPDATDVIYQGDAVAANINDHGDICFTADNRLVLHRDGIGLMSLDAYVVGDDDSVSSWINSDYVKAHDILNPATVESNNVSYPVIVGYANLPGLGVEEAFVLVPVDTP